MAKQLSVEEAIVERAFHAGVDYAERRHKRRRVQSQDGEANVNNTGAVQTGGDEQGLAVAADGAGTAEVQAATEKPEFQFSPVVTLEAIRAELAEFALERDWDQFHSPRNLALAMVGEVGELCECFQWKGEVPEGLPGWSDKERSHLGQEMADVLLYLLRLSHKCRVDLARAALDKLAVNAAKYPAALVRGSSKKYSEYKALSRQGKIPE